MVNIDPKKYGLHPRVKLKGSGKEIFILIERKSRVIMKDGNRILQMAEKIKQASPTKKISVLSTAPVCRKTEQLLLKNNITVKKTKIV